MSVVYSPIQLEAAAAPLSCPRSWYAVRVNPNFEKTAAVSPRAKGYIEFLPLYRAVRQWSDRKKTEDLPLFPGHIFARFNPDIRTPILATPGVVGIVAIGRMPYPVEDAELEAVRRVAREGLPAEPWPFLHQGQRIRITSGSLMGTEGLLHTIRNQSHLVLQETLLQRAVLVHIDRQSIAPVS